MELLNEVLATIGLEPSNLGTMGAYTGGIIVGAIAGAFITNAYIEAIMKLMAENTWFPYASGAVMGVGVSFLLLWFIV